MPFKSKAQAGAAFGGYLGPEMKKKAHKWAKETPNMEKLPKHVEESTLNEAQLANSFTFWVVEKSKGPGDNPLDLVFETDPIGFANQVRGGLMPQDIYGFYLEEDEAHNAAHDQVEAVFEAAKALEEKKGEVTAKIEEVIKKLQEKVNSCMEEGLDEEAQMHLQKISELRAKNQAVEASKKKIEKLEEGWFDRQVASLKGSGAAVGTGVRNIGRAIMGNDTKSVALARNVAKLSQKAKTLDKAVTDMQNDINILFPQADLNKAPENFKKAFDEYTATLKRVKDYNATFMKGGARVPTDQQSTTSQDTQSSSNQQSTTQQSSNQQQQSTTQQTSNQQQSTTQSLAGSGNKLSFDGKEYTVDKDGKVRVTVGGKRIRLTPIDYQGTKVIPLVKDKQGNIQQVEKRGDKLYIKGTNREVAPKKTK